MAVPLRGITISITLHKFAYTIWFMKVTWNLVVSWTLYLSIGSPKHKVPLSLHCWHFIYNISQVDVHKRKEGWGKGSLNPLMTKHIVWTMLCAGKMPLLLESLSLQRGRLDFLGHAAKHFDHQTLTFPFIGSSHRRWAPENFKGLCLPYHHLGFSWFWG